ncbi:MAG: GNAT family N-acetyltransferase [Thermoproteota archaeon]|nr:GNAT family N-acetyltransferase [Candidatus Brockarchaeota archaeon]
MRLVEFEESYFEEVQKLLNLSLFEDVVSDRSLRRITFDDPNYNKRYALVALENEEVVGFILGAKREKAPEELVETQKELAWIKVFAVRENYRRKGIATKLFEELENRFRDSGTKKVRITDFPGWTLFCGVDLKYQDALAFLLGRGFKKVGEAVDYEIDLLNFYIPRRILQTNVSPAIIRKAEKSDKNKVLSWVKTEFSVFWEYEASVGFMYDKPKLWIAEDNDEIIGFSVYSALEPHWFGPIGVSPKTRLKGIGSLLLFNCLKSMREEGQRIAVIPWTSHLFFYAQVPGINKIRHYWILEKAFV